MLYFCVTTIASIVSGFLGAVGYKVLKASVQTACGSYYYKYPLTLEFWMFFLPAVAMGFPLYLFKKNHWGKPVVVLG